MSDIQSFEAQIYKVQTTVDSGARITLDLGYDANVLIAKLLQKKMAGEDQVRIVFLNEEE